ncbi:OmpA family protein [Pseudomonas sp. CGJS7]|uniref:OmpA family protein n=1 Tax=Pseudomonas sp. CGJS7 TaxID=3109348 RepID=UPI003009147F
MKFRETLLAFSIPFALAASSILAGTAHAQSYEPTTIEFPSPDRATTKEGAFPNVDNVRNMAPGLSKKQVYQLLGTPHFSEGVFGVREWDYIFKFRVDGQVITCQYKVLYDRDYSTSSMHWAPEGCADAALNPPVPRAPAPIAAPPPPSVMRSTTTTLSSEALFAFGKSGLADMLPKGRGELRGLAESIKSASRATVRVVGHADRIGSSDANLALSTRRAQTVRQALINEGIAASAVTARGAGDSEPVSDCADGLSRKQLVACLQPDRRVEVTVDSYN